MCLAATLLIIKCVGYLPQPGASITVSRACISGFPARARRAAKGCAAEHNVSWRIGP